MATARTAADAPELVSAETIRERLPSTAFAFRGYNVTNLGRSRELLMHPAYGPIVERRLQDAAEVSSEAAGRKLDLVARVRNGVESSLESFAEDVPLITTIEEVQIELLREFFDIDFCNARLAIGYSIGEIAALACGGVYKMSDLLRPLLNMADECAELARDVAMGVVFSRGAALELDAVERLCLRISNEGRGAIAVSSFLSPNTVLVLGQGETVDRFKEEVRSTLGKHIHLRKNDYRWPPLHTSLLWQKNIPNRAAVIMQTMPGGFTKPTPDVLSLATGRTLYNDFNSRDLMNRWVDHPQHLWEALQELLALGVPLVIHVGPEPNLIPATFKRLSDNINMMLHRWSLNSSLGLRAVSGIVRRPWLSKLVSARTAVLRAPFVAHIVLEDWLLAQPVPR